MSFYFDLLPDELFVNIIYYLDTYEINENKYVQSKMSSNKWLLLFLFTFPDIYLNLIENINYSIQDFDYFYLIYMYIKSSYESVNHDINWTNNRVLGVLNKLEPSDRSVENLEQIYSDFRTIYKFRLDQVSNFNLKYLIINKNQKLKDMLVSGDEISSIFYLIFEYNKFYIENPSLPIKINLTLKEALTLAIYINYANILIYK